MAVGVPRANHFRPCSRGPKVRGESTMTDKSPCGEQDPFAPVRKHEAAVEAVAERDDALGATAQCLVKWAHDENPWETTVEASYFDLDVGSAGFERWSPTYSGDPPEALAEYAEAFAAAAERTDDPTAADALRILAAVGQGEDPPRAAVRQARGRATDGDDEK